MNNDPYYAKGRSYGMSCVFAGLIGYGVLMCVLYVACHGR